MNSLLAMYIEVRYQLEDLTYLNLMPPDNPENSLFIGSGDSHAAALVAQYASNHRAQSCYPTDILTNPDILNDKTAYFISISGNTLDNILAARIAKKKDVRTVAITRDPRSKLARLCDDLIELKYRTTGITTSGSIGFGASLLVCLSLVKKVNRLPDLTCLFEGADRMSDSLVIAQKFSSYIILGSGLLFPIALYGALKANEILGIRSYAYTIDEFFHAPIFGVTKTDRIIILGNTSNSPRSDLLDGDANGLNFSSLDFGYSSQNYLSMLLQSLFVIQLFMIKNALQHGFRQCSFLTNKKILKLSSHYIYA